MSTTKTLSMFVSIFALAAAPAAMAQQAEVPWMGTGTNMFSVTAGGQVFDVGDQLDTVGTDLSSEWNLGARYQINFSPNIGVEAGVNFSPSDFNFVGPGLGSRDVNALYYTGNLVYNILPDAPVIPYLTGGAGAVTLFVDNVEDTNSDTKFVGNFGGGLLFPVAERFGLRFEVRDYIYRIDNLDADFGGELSVPPGFEETVNDLSITGGFTILF